MEKSINLLEDDIKKALLRMSIPLAFTAFIQMAYNLIDMAWIGRIGTNAVAAVGTMSILSWICNALSLIAKTGMGVYSSQSYGRGDKDKTSMIYQNGYILGVVMALIFSSVVYIIKDKYIGFYNLGSDVESLANEYIKILNIGYIFVFLNPLFSQSYNSLGDSKTPFLINSIGLIFNIILDPILIFGYLGFKPLGIRGAAIATVLSQSLVSIILIFSILNSKDVIRNSLRKFYVDIKWISRIFKLGLPTALISSIHAFVTIILNKYMAGFGPKPVAVYSIGSQIESITWMTTEGIQVAIAALVAQNFGASLYDRVQKSIKEGIKLAFFIGLFATLVLFIFRNGLFKIFVPNDAEAIRLGGIYLAILSLSQIMAAIEIASTGAFNGLSDTKTPFYISATFNLLRIPLSKILIGFIGVYGVWASMTISSNLKGLIELILLRKKSKRIFK